jgi:hypothetical protein
MGSRSGGAGCLVDDSQQICDCVYRMLRSEGHPASQLASMGPDLTSGAGPIWYNHARGQCIADTP